MNQFNLLVLSIALSTIVTAAPVEQYILSDATSSPVNVMPSTNVNAASLNALQLEVEKLRETVQKQDTKINQMMQKNNAATTNTTTAGPAATRRTSTTTTTNTAAPTTTNRTNTATTSGNRTSNTASTTTTSTNTTRNNSATSTTARNSSAATSNTSSSRSGTGTIANQNDANTATNKTANATTTTNRSPSTATTTTKTAVTTNNLSDKDAYQAASLVYEHEGVAKAIQPMQDFIKKYPNSSLIPNAHFWLGEFNLGLTPPRALSAKTNFKIVVDKYPKSNLAPLALSRLAEISQNLDRDTNQANAYYKQLLEKYPASKEAIRDKNLIKP
ncbi:MULTISPECIES: tetratricopeptide repeat protein [unclassified Acinetobacter]|uniref:tetratricopeptide repeat protein n=1 Tax=unclassified Acinetobacter TaxID=196816 RepID=UPI0035BAA008